MDVTPNTRTITEYTLTLSEADAQAALADPFSFGEQIAERLRPHLPAVNGNGKRPKPKASQQFHFSRKAKAGPKAKAATKKGVRPASASLQRVSCPQCGQEIAQKYLNLHLAKKHSAAAPASAAPSVSTN